MKTPDVADLENKLRQEIGFVEEAIVRIRNDEITDMRRLEADLGLLCAAVETLPPDQSERLQPLMAEMIAKLEEMAVEVNNYQDRQDG